MDVSITHPKCEIGALSVWKAYDFSGIVKGKFHNTVQDMLFYEGVESNKPFWNTFSTWEIQDVGLGVKQDERQVEADRIAAEIADQMYVGGQSRISVREICKKYDMLDDRSMKTMVGQRLSSRHGIVKDNFDARSKFYVIEEDLMEGEKEESP